MIGQTAAPGSRISICRASLSVGAEMGSYICTGLDLFLNGRAEQKMFVIE
jgi:hypothetical protein